MDDTQLLSDILEELRRIHNHLEPPTVIAAPLTAEVIRQDIETVYNLGCGYTAPTKETWRLDRRSNNSWAVLSGDTTIATAYTEADAQRISAVPELIDALERIHNESENPEGDDFVHITYDGQLASQVRSALLKAGVEPKAGGE